MRFVRWISRRLMHAGKGPQLLSSFLCAAAVASVPASARAAFPTDAQWIPITKGGKAISDPVGDSQAARDIVGDAANPPAYVYADATQLCFRLRVDDTVLQNANNFKPFGWGCLLDTDGNLADGYE